MTETPTPTPPSTSAPSGVGSVQATLFPEPNASGTPEPTPAAETPAAEPEPSAPDASLAVGKPAEDPDAPILADPAAEGEGDPTPPPPIDPAAYELTLPEGFTANEPLMADARKVFAEIGVPVDKAQGLVDLFTRAVQESAASNQSAYEAQAALWRRESNALPELQGPTRETTLSKISRVFDEYGSQDLRNFLAVSKLGDYPGMVKMMVKLADVLAEGAPASPGRPAPNGKDGSGPRVKTVADLFSDSPS